MVLLQAFDRVDKDGEVPKLSCDCDMTRDCGLFAVGFWGCIVQEYIPPKESLNSFPTACQLTAAGVGKRWRNCWPERWRTVPERFRTVPWLYRMVLESLCFSLSGRARTLQVGPKPDIKREIQDIVKFFVPSARRIAPSVAQNSSTCRSPRFVSSLCYVDMVCRCINLSYIHLIYIYTGLSVCTTYKEI